MTDFNLFSLLAGAGFFAWLVLLALTALLYLSIWFILRKRRMFADYARKCDAFERHFWAGGDIDDLEQRARAREFGDYGLAHIFLFGQEEFKKACETGGDNTAMILQSVQRALESAILNEETRLNRHMTFLSTVASNSPYIGLLGTVWGIITALQGLAHSAQSTVSQGMAEALIATAMGLLAAIPAGIAYNYFNHEAEVFMTRFDNFANHYLNILHRNI